MQCLYLKDHLDVLNNAHKIRDPQLSRHQQNIKTQAHQQKVKAPTKKQPSSHAKKKQCATHFLYQIFAGLILNHYSDQTPHPCKNKGYQILPTRK